MKLKKKELLSFLQKSPVALFILIEILVGSGLSLFSLGIFSYLSDKVLDSERIFFDHLIIQFFASIQSTLMTNIMLFFSFLGGAFLFIAFSFILVLLIYKKHYRETVIFLIIVLMGAVINALIKMIFARPRPDIAPYLIERDYSFPSGHSMDAFVFYMTLGYLMYHFTRKGKLSLALTALALGVVLMIGASRIYLGVHYPSDILGGYVAGVLWLVSVIVIDRTLELFRLFREFEHH
jgi:undecaprenyl-diphosphatase